MKKTIMAIIALLAATVEYAGDSAPFRLDTVTTSTSPVVDSISISWDASWIGGNANAMVVIADNGTEVKRATGSGQFTYSLAGVLRHDLTYTTYIGGVAQSEVYATTAYTKYEVSFNANGGSVGEASRYVTPGNVIGSLPTPTRTGYTFKGWWTSASGGTQIAASTTVTGHVTYYAQWTANEYEVTFDAEGGEVEGGDGHAGRVTLPMTYDSEYGELPVVTRTGYTFNGWMLDDTVVTSNTVVKTAEDHTLVALWVANEYEVTFDTTGGEVEGGDGHTGRVTLPMTYDSEYGELPVVTRTGYTFYGWMLDDTVVTSNTVVNTAGAHTLVARWIANEYEVTFNAVGGEVEGGDGHAGRVTLPMTYDSEYGELPTASCEGYVFLGWFMSDVEVTATNVVKTADDHTLTAKWGIRVGNGIWVVTVCDDPITLGAPLVPPTGEVVIPATIAGRSVVGITAAAFARNAAVTGVTVRLVVDGVAEGVLGNIPLTVVVEDDGQYIIDAIAGNVRKVVFAEGVTRIGDNFMCGGRGATALPNLETIDIAESVVRIGTNVFDACSALETVVTNGVTLYQGWCLGFGDNGHAGSVIIPEGVRGIAAGAFEGEYGIETVEMPSTLRFVGARAFKDCTALEGIALPEGVVAVDREAFRNCTYAQELSMPGSLEEIGYGAFANCALLMGVTLPDGVLDVGEYAFSNCWRMLSASIPCSVTNVGAGAFAECRRLAGVTVPLGLARIADLFPAAYGKIASVVVGGQDGGCPSQGGATGHAGRVTLPMVPGMFAGCGAMESLTLPEDLAEVSADAFAGCTNMVAFNLPDTVTNIGARAFKDLEQLAAFAFPTGLVVVGEEAFAGCAGIGSLTLPEGLREIGEQAFQGLSLLARVDVPGSVMSVGAGAFGGCARVRAISLPGDAATVAEMFPDTYGLIASATVVNSRQDGGYPSQGGGDSSQGGGDFGQGTSTGDRVMDSLFEGCAGLVAVEMPASLTAIGARAFKGCSSLTAAGIPSGVTELGEETFMGCANLSQMALPNGLSELPDRAFANCASLAEVTVPESVTELGADVFTGCSLLRSIRFVGNAPAYDSAAYGGTDAALVTYVPNGSMGWDGVPTSRALPEFWPDGTTHEIMWWEPNRFLVDFVADGGTGAVTAQVEQVTGTTYVLPADATRQGAVFGGWWTAVDGGARVTAVTRVALTRPHAFYAHWTFNRYAVVFDANGGDGTMDVATLTVATSANLPECGFSRAGYAFAGWATESEGEVVYTNAAEVLDLAYEQGASVTLYAVWEEREWTLADYVDCGNLVFLNDGEAAGSGSQPYQGGAPWTPDWETYKVGGVSLRSGEIPAAEEEGGRTNTTLTATVVGAGSGSFWWKVSCEEMDEEYDEWYDYAVFTIDGVEVAKIAGDSGWQLVEYVVSGSGAHTLAWTFSRDDYDEDGAEWQNSAWLDGVVWTPTPVTVTFAAGGATEGTVPEAVTRYEGYELTLPGAGTLANGASSFMGWSDGDTTYAAGTLYVFGSTDVTLTAIWGQKTWTLAEAVDSESLSFTTGGDAEWSVDATVGWTNGVSAKSGTVTSGQTSWIETTVNGTGTLSFSWNVMGGIFRNNPFAYAKVEVDGTQQAQEHMTDGWKGQTLEVSGAGAHTIRWTYLRTSSRTAEGDCAWLDGVTWTPAVVANIVVEFDDGKTVTVPTEWMEAHENIVRDNGGDVLAALRSTAANGRMSVVECYVLGLDPEVAADDFKITSFPMKADGTPDLENMAFAPAKAQWNVQDARAVVKGAATLEGPWTEVPEGGNPAYRFFKVVVELP